MFSLRPSNIGTELDTGTLRNGPDLRFKEYIVRSKDKRLDMEIIFRHNK